MRGAQSNVLDRLKGFKVRSVYRPAILLAKLVDHYSESFRKRKNYLNIGFKASSNMALVAASVTAQQHEKLDDLQKIGTPSSVLEIYSVLSNRDSFEIFCLANSGIRATTRVLGQHEFSRKRYYVRLRQLIDTGLVQKEGGFYRHTALGKEVFESQVERLQQLLSTAGQSHAIASKTNSMVNTVFS